ncbi:MAG: universal stress protein [Victivallaceae bacterium]
MKKIMACIDFREGTDLIVEKGIELAAKFDVGLCLIHVAPPKDVIPQCVAGKKNFPEVARRLCSCSNKFQTIVAKIKDAGINVTTYQKRGEAVNEIAGRALDEKVDIIVMGARNTSAMRHLIGGSVPAEVMKRTKISVLLVPIPAN